MTAYPSARALVPTKLTRLVFGEHWAKVRELWFAGSRKRFIVVHPVVERQGVVCVREVFFALLFNLKVVRRGGLHGQNKQKVFYMKPE